MGQASVRRSTQARIAVEGIQCLNDLHAGRPLAHKRRIRPRFAAVSLMAAVQHEWQPALGQSARDSEVAISQAIAEVQHGGAKPGLIGEAETLAGIRSPSHIGSGGLQDRLKAACDKWLALNHKD
jgi:hypothetical protein